MGKQHAISVVFLITFIVCSIYVPPALSSLGLVETRYDVTTKGFRIGNVITTQRMTSEEGVPVAQFENTTEVAASFLWMKYCRSGCEKANVRGDRLVAYSRSERVNGAGIRVEGRLVGDTFRFEVTENGKRRCIDVPCHSYERTTMECPEATMDFQANGERTVRILDTEHMVVVKRRYRLVRNDVYKIDGREYPCRVVDFSDPNKSCRRWIGRDGNAIIVFRQDGRGREGSYSVRAVALNRV